MARYDKYHMSDVVGLIAHDNRTLKTERENVDESRSYLNYNLHEHENGEYNFFKNRVEYVKQNGGTVRDNSVVMVSLIVTLPEDFPNNEELEKQFFNAVYEMAKENHGEENIISAWVHYDEAKKKENDKLNKPHIHLKFTPVLKTKKKYKNKPDKERLAFNANKIITPEYLQKFHTDLDKYIEDFIGFKTSVINGATIDGNKTVKELKKITKNDKEIRNMIESDFKLIEAERKKILNDYWEEYKEYSNSYWSYYKTTKERIKNEIWEIKKTNGQITKQLENDLDFISNLSRGLLFALFKLFTAIIIYNRKRTLEKELDTIQGKLETLDKERRSISNYQHNTKEKLKEKDLDKIETALNSWENAIIKANEKTKENILNRTENENKGHLRAFRDSYEDIDK